MDGKDRSSKVGGLEYLKNITRENPQDDHVRWARELGRRKIDSSRDNSTTRTNPAGGPKVTWMVRDDNPGTAL